MKTMKMFLKTIIFIILVLITLHPSKVVFAGYEVKDSADITPTAGTWYTWTSASAFNGSVKASESANAELSWQFYGDRVAYLYSVAYQRGAVQVLIDNQIVDAIDAYSPVVRRQIGKVYHLNSAGTHTIKIKNKSNQGMNGRTYIDVDAFVSDIRAFAPGIRDDGEKVYDNGVYYVVAGYHGSGWTVVQDSSAYGGAYKTTTTSGDGFRINFNGDSIRWYFPYRSDYGVAYVSIDGEFHGSFNPSLENVNNYYWAGLGSGYHLMTVTVYPASNGSRLSFDYFDIGGTTSYKRTMASGYADGWSHGRNPNYVINLNGDCTNFTSQAQVAGGLPMHPTDLNQQVYYDLTQWWSNLGNWARYSNTWAITPDYFSYADNNRPEYSIQYNDTSYLRRGEIMLLDEYDTREFSHARVISQNGYVSPFIEDYSGGGDDLSSTFEFGLLIDQHTTDRWHVPLCYNYDCETLLTAYIKIDQ